MLGGRQKRWLLIAFICFISIIGLLACQITLWWTTEVERDMEGGEIALRHQYGLDEYETGSPYFSELRGTTPYSDEKHDPVHDDTIKVFEETSVLIGFSIILLIISFFLSIIIFITKKFKIYGTAILIITMFFTLITPLYFGMALPSAMEEDHNDRELINDENDAELQLLDGVTPWYTKSFSGDQNEGGVKVTWRPLIGWYMAIGVFVFTCISILFSIFPSKTQSPKNGDQPAPKPKSNGLKRFRKIVAVITIVTLVLGGLTCYIIYLPWKYNVASNTGSSELDSIDITITPEDPKEGELIKIDVEVLSERCRISYFTFFSDDPSTESKMERVKVGEFTTTIGPFQNGTDIWGIARGFGTFNDDYILKEFTIQIGTVIRDDTSSLRINNVVQTPETLTSTDKTITMTAQVNSNADIENVEMKFFAYGSSTFMRLSRLELGTNNTYSTEVDLTDSDIAVGDEVYYKIGAKDLSGNTVVTPTTKFTVI